MKRILATVAGVAVAALALTSCASAGDAADGGQSSAPSELKIGNFLDLVTWDPSAADIGFNGPYLSAVYDPLIALDGEGQPVPALATGWEVSDDSLTITMDIRDDAVFSNGEKLDADAVVENLEFLQRGIVSQEAYLNVEGFEAVDADTVEIRMKQRDDRLLYFMGLGRSYMVAPSVIEAGTAAEAPVGSGPYTLSDSTVPGAEYHFDRVADHWAADEFTFDSVTIVPLQDPAARLNAMEAGQVNVIFADASMLSTAESNGWSVARKIASWAGLRINDHTGSQVPALGDERVRQALNYAFDGASLLDSVAQGLGEPSRQVFAVGYPGYDPAIDERYEFDMAKAKQLLAEAGYADGFDIAMPMAPAFQPWQPIVEQTFDQLGIRLTWDEYQMADYQANAGTYPMFIVSLAVDSDPVATIARQLTVPQWYNPKPDISEFPELQAQVDTALTAPRGDVQDAEIVKLNELITDAGWFVPWYQSDNVFLTDPGIELTPVTGMMFPTLRQIQPAG